MSASEAELSEVIYFKIYKSQIPALDRRSRRAAQMLGSDKSRGYCLEMICADFRQARMNATD